MYEELIGSILIAAIGAIPPTLMAYAALKQSRLTAVKTDENTVITAQTNDKTDALIEKTEVIHQLTNSNLTAVKADLEIANNQIKDLQELVSRLVDEREEKEAETLKEP